MVSQELLFRGYGKVMMIQPNTLYETMLEEAEESARKRGAGLWGACESGL
jgi:endonuclease YncB( thermonuclease family)